MPPHLARTTLRGSAALLGLSMLLVAAPASAGKSPPPAPSAVPTMPPAPWDREFFTAQPAALQAALAQLPPPKDTSVRILFEEQHVDLAPDGRKTLRVRRVYQILTPAGLDQRGRIEAPWSPWFEDTPEIRARVVNPDGRTYLLDPNTIERRAARETSPDLYSDRQLLRAPLPGLGMGSLVEEEVLTRDAHPLFTAGTTLRVLFGASVPIQRFRLVVEAARALPLHHLIRRLPGLVPRREEKDGRVRLTFETGPLPALESPPSGLPSDVAPAPYVGIATGRSWHDVAAEYHRIVEEQLAKSDVQALAAQAMAGTPGREALAARVLALVHREVRYTGVEFAEASIVPRPTGETLARKYGDCKDQALLTVALLRAAGLKARVALLRVSIRLDTEEALPGLGGFDHAIVYVDGPRPLWIDPTDEYARAGELPGPDQGRLALIAAPETTGLVRTPEARAEDNRWTETREFQLAELGPARVTEVTEFYGALERFFRRRYADIDQQALTRQLTAYVEKEYAARRLLRVDTGDPQDLSRPFRLVIEAGEAARGTTADNDAAVAFFPAALLRMLPGELDGSEESPPASGKERSEDYVFALPFIMEHRYRIVPAPGLVPGVLPEPTVIRLGPAQLSYEFTRAEDGVVTGTVRFHSGPNRYRPAEMKALRTAVAELRKGQAVLIRFEHQAAGHLAAGRVREALAEYRRLAALHPREPLHAAQLALALLQVGLGAAARREARRAVMLDERSVVAHRILGWTLEHDEAGRHYHQGFDRPGAIAAYRKALSLEGATPEIRRNLAVLLEFSDQGERYGQGADLAGALKEYRTLPEGEVRKALRTNALWDLFWLGRYPELATEARALPSSLVHDQLLIAAVALDKGATAALREAEQRQPDLAERARPLTGAFVTLLRGRHYGRAADLLVAIGNTTGQGTQAPILGILRKLRPYEELPRSGTDPRSFLQQFLIALVTRHDLAAVRPFLTEELAGTLTGRDLAALFRLSVTDATSFELPPRVLADIVVASVDFALDGDDRSGYRVRGRSVIEQSGKGELTLFLQRRPAGYRIAGDGDELFGVGEAALARLQAGDPAGARRWLQWAREQLPPSAEDAAVPYRAVLASLWPSGLPEDVARLRLIAAVLASSSPRPERALPLLRAGRDLLPSGGPRTDLETLIGAAELRAGQAQEALATVEPLLATRSDRAGLFLLKTGALRELHRDEEVRRLAEQRQRQFPGDRTALEALWQLARERQDLEAYKRLMRGLIDNGKAEGVHYNELAWSELVSGHGDAAALGLAERAVALTKRKDASALHTLAALTAVNGKPLAAYQILLERMALNDQAEPDFNDWYVLGLIAEGAGEKDEAIAAYRRAVSHRDDSSWSSSALAQTRLKALSAP
ncbi:MAG TPA: DUF3857 domain-containing protein [Polyangia bacterium]|nr:DUF3857 domain-containing protein [Polyangia bacterium]